MENAERFKALEAAAIESAAQGLKAMLLLNGGACVALLAFVGSLATSETLQPEFAPLVKVVARSLIWFATGAGSAVLACLFAYWANQAYSNHLMNPGKSRWETGTRWTSVGGTCGIFSIACFAKGVLDIAFALP